MPRRAGIGGLGHGLGAGSLAGKQAAQVCMISVCRLFVRRGDGFLDFFWFAVEVHTTYAQVRAHDVGEQLTAQHSEQMVQQSKMFKVLDVFRVMCQ